MRILHVSLGWPPFRTGGLVRYCCDLMDEQVRQGHAVGMLYPAGNSHRGHGYINISQRGGIASYGLYTRNLVPLVFGVADPGLLDCSNDDQAYQKVLDDFRPDVVHVHSIQGIGFRFFERVRKRGIRQVFTTHDYYPICLRTNYICSNGKLCNEPDEVKCATCNLENGLTYRKALLMQSKLYQKIKDNRIAKVIRKEMKAGIRCKQGETIELSQGQLTEFRTVMRTHFKIIEQMDIIHANSELAAMYYRRWFPEKKIVVIPLTHSGVVTQHVKKEVHNPIRIGYVGGANRYKGYQVLFEALSELSHDLGWMLFFYGTSPSTGEIPESIRDRVQCRGFYKDAEAKRVFSEMDLLVVPSIWPETFGFVVIEALAVGTVVVCSDMVGAKQLVDHEFIFKSTKHLARIITAFITDSSGIDCPELTIETSIEVHTKGIKDTLYS